MTSVMISIKPKWCELIASGKKTIEVRKTRPRIAVPFKCYIYETQGKKKTSRIDKKGRIVFKGLGKVIGEFVCDEIVTAECGSYCNLNPTETLLHAFDLLDYADGKTVYGWHISDLVIYDKPKELSEFWVEGYQTYDCPPLKKLKRPPQSWCYVESVEGDKE